MDMDIILPINFTDGVNNETISLPISLPISFDGDRKCTVVLPVTLPISFSSNSNKPATVSLPVTLPISFNSGGKPVISLPITLPMSFYSGGIVKKKTTIPYIETVSLDKYHGLYKVLYKEKASGKVAKTEFREHSWRFDGLILNENVITTLNAQQTLTENIQALILVDFELMSTNKLKFTWYGHSVPSFTVMMKSFTDEKYIKGNTYNWNDKEGYAEIKSEDYNIYLQGVADSGTSAIYTIAGVNNILVLPKLQVNLNEKIYNIPIDNTATHIIKINY